MSTSLYDMEQRLRRSRDRRRRMEERMGEGRTIRDHPMAGYLLDLAPQYLGDPAETPARNLVESEYLRESKVPGTGAYYAELAKRHAGDPLGYEYELMTGRPYQTPEEQAYEALRGAFDITTGAGMLGRGSTSLLAGPGSFFGPNPAGTMTAGGVPTLTAKQRQLAPKAASMEGAPVKVGTQQYSKGRRGLQERREFAEDVLRAPVPTGRERAADLTDRALIRDAMEGQPGIPQEAFERAMPGPRQSVGAQVRPWESEFQRDLTRRQIERGRGAAGGEWYPSTYPLRARGMELGMDDDWWKDWAWANALTSPQSPVAVNAPTASAILHLQRRGLPITKDNLQLVQREMMQKYGDAAKGYFAGPVELDNYNAYLAAGRIPPTGFDKSQKVSSYGAGLYGNLQNVPMDTHELAGTSFGHSLFPYWRSQSSVPSTSYGVSEGPYRAMAQEMGLPPASAQASRWIGGGELTGLKTQPDRFLDIYEDLARYKATMAGDPSRATAQRFLDMSLTGEEPLLPYYARARMPIDYSLFR